MGERGETEIEVRKGCEMGARPKPGIKNMKEYGLEGGFSLIELIIAMTILIILSGVLFLGTGVAKRRETEKYANSLRNQITLSQTAAMAKTGKWRVGLYLKDKDYYSVHEVEKRTGENEEDVFWEIQSEKVMLGRSGAVNYELKSGESGSTTGTADGEKGILLHTWRFDRDTGSCIEGAGTLAVTGAGKTHYLTVYRENGRCEIDETLPGI